jgi:hypothetical protein
MYRIAPLVLMHTLTVAVDGAEAAYATPDIVPMRTTPATNHAAFESRGRVFAV